MSLHFLHLTRASKEVDAFERINREAFPPSEYMPFDEVFDLAEQTNTDVLGLCDDGTPVGFIVFLKNESCGYIFFLAIDKAHRSKGYGSRALKLLANEYPKLQIILDFEELDPNAENYEQRVRRKAFYLNNGFCETGHYTLLRGERFEVVCNMGELLAEPFKRVISVIHSHCPYFPNELL